MSLTANSSGVVTGKFTIPAGLPAGSKTVLFEGGSSRAAATFVGRGQLHIQTLREIENSRWLVTTTETLVPPPPEPEPEPEPTGTSGSGGALFIDPVAQTFVLDQAALISGAEVWFTAKGTTGKTLVTIREVQTGMPTLTVLASAVVASGSLTVGGYHRFTWTPIRLEANKEYALVVGADDPETAVGVAELAKFDPTAQRWVTAQPYQIGVLLSSSNGSTWTPHQEQDMTFRLLAMPVSATTETVALPSISVSGCDEGMILAAVERPDSLTDVVFELTLPDNSVLRVAEGQRIVFPTAVTGTIAWKAILTGTSFATPRLHKDVQFVYGTRGTSQTYVSRAIPAGTGSKVTVYYEVLTPGTSTVSADVSPDGTTWTPVPVSSGTPVGDSWVEVKRYLGTYSGSTARVRLTLNGDARNRPQVRKLRVVVT